MISSKSIIEAVASVLGECFPTMTVNTQFMPANFSRPAIYIEMGERKLEDMGCGLVDVTAQIKVEVILPATAQGHGDKLDLAEAGVAVVAPLWGTALAVEGATLLIHQGVAQGLGADYAPVVLTATYQDNAPCSDDAEALLELMEEFDITSAVSF